VSCDGDLASARFKSGQRPRPLDVGKCNLHGLKEISAARPRIFDQVTQHLTVDG
jgi:hypothetical protein